MAILILGSFQSLSPPPPSFPSSLFLLLKLNKNEAAQPLQPPTMANIDLARPAPTPSPSSSAIYNDSASSVTATASNKSLLDSSAFASSVLDWDVDRVCKWISELGLSKYTSNFKESNITGNVLISLNQAHLQEIGVASVGHRLRILKSVYNITEAQEIDAGPDRYIPPSKSQKIPTSCLCEFHANVSFY